MNKGLGQQRDEAAEKYARKHNAGQETVDAFIDGAIWWKNNCLKAVKEYEKELTKAVENRIGAVEPFLKLQIRKTARLWQLRDRLAEELDFEDTFMRNGTGSMKQNTENIDPRATLLEKYDRTLTADLTALGLNFNTTPSKVKEDTRKGVDETDPMARMMAEAQKALED